MAGYGVYSGFTAVVALPGRSARHRAAPQFVLLAGSLPRRMRLLLLKSKGWIGA
jgi:hypothetical protein